MHTIPTFCRLSLPPPACKESLSSWAVQLCVARQGPLLTTGKVGLPAWMWWESSLQTHPQLRAACEAGFAKERLKEHVQAGPSARDLTQMLSSLGQGFCGLPISDRGCLICAMTVENELCWDLKNKWVCPTQGTKCQAGAWIFVLRSWKETALP